MASCDLLDLRILALREDGENALELKKPVFKTG